jgi:4-hydroxy-2-oxoheptanedioate aldolase
MANAVKARWAAGQPIINGWLAAPSGFVAEVMAQAGWDSLTVDMQHGVQDYLSVVACFQGMQPHGVTPMVRVPWNEPGVIGKVLDAGALGVICPMVNTRAQAEAFVAACRYPPQGARSFGPIRAGIYGQAGPGWTTTSNADVICMPMIETQEAMGNLDAILDVPGVDAVYVGPGDLGLSYGLVPRMDREEPEMLARYEHIVAETRKRGLAAGIHCGSAAYAARAIRMGFRLVTIGNDTGLLLGAARQAVASVREELHG